MVMPEGVSGMELAERLWSLRPGLKVVFTSGYTVQEVGPEVLARTGAHFLQKPLLSCQPGRIIRDCLDKTAPVGAVA